MIASVKEQIYDDWELCIADDASRRSYIRRILEEEAQAEPRIILVFREENGNICAASNSALALASGDFVALLDHDDKLAPHALAMMAEAINGHPDADIFYSDEDKLDADGQRYGAYFKPDWNPELLYGQNFISHLGVYRTSLLRELGGFRAGFEGSQDYDLALRATAATKGSIVHVPHVLYHWRVYAGAGNFSSTQLERSLDAARRAIKEHFATRGVEVSVRDAGHYFHRVLHKNPAIWPRVSVVLNAREHPELLSACIDGLLGKTDYADLEIIVVCEDGEKLRACLPVEILAERGVQVVRNSSRSTVSQLRNEAVRHSSGEIILFLDSDISVVVPDWLNEMVFLARQPNIGAVGAKLLLPDGTLWHGGMALGLNQLAGHIHLGAPKESLGYLGRLLLVQEVSCVTAACMAVSRAVFDRVGGFDERNLFPSFNDVDLCLRIRQAGCRVIWTPHALLHRQETTEQGAKVGLERQRVALKESVHMRERWGDMLDHDPFWNPNLSLQSSDPRISFPPRVARPWREKRT